MLTRTPGVSTKNPENRWSLTEAPKNLALFFHFYISNEITKEMFTQLDTIWHLKRRLVNHIQINGHCHELKSHPEDWQNNAFKIQMFQNNSPFLRVLQEGAVGL